MSLFHIRWRTHVLQKTLFHECVACSFLRRLTELDKWLSSVIPCVIMRHTDAVFPYRSKYAFPRLLINSIVHILAPDFPESLITMSGCRVFIGRLSPHARERDVEKFFKGYGHIREINLKNGFGFVVSIGAFLRVFCMRWYWNVSYCPLLSGFHRSLTTTGTQMTQCTSWMEKSCVVRGKTKSRGVYTICLIMMIGLFHTLEVSLKLKCTLFCKCCF